MISVFTHPRARFAALGLFAVFLLGFLAALTFGFRQSRLGQAQSGLVWDENVFASATEAVAFLSSDDLALAVAEAQEASLAEVRKRLLFRPEPRTRLIMVRSLGKTNDEALRLNQLFISALFSRADDLFESDPVDADVASTNKLLQELDSLKRENRLLIRSAGIQEAQRELLQSRRFLLERELPLAQSSVERRATGM